MSKVKVFAWLAVAAECVGIGMIFGYTIGEGSNNTALWVGGILIFLGAIAIGMSISSRDQVSIVPSETAPKTEKTDNT